MTEKKQAFTLLDYFLFRHDFSMYFEVPIEDCAEGIRRMDFQPLSFFDTRKQEVKIQPLDYNTVAFDIQRKRRNRGMFILSARAQGTLIDNGDGTTSLHGAMRSGIWFVLIAVFPAVIIVPVFVFLFGSDPVFTAYVFIAFAISFAVIGGMLAKDRRDIRRDLQSSVTIRNVPKRRPGNLA